MSHRLSAALVWCLTLRLFPEAWSLLNGTSTSSQGFALSPFTAVPKQAHGLLEREHHHTLATPNPDNLAAQSDPWPQCRFERTAQCKSFGPRRPHQDQPCNSTISSHFSGVCACTPSLHVSPVHCRHPPFTCLDRCTAHQQALNRTPGLVLANAQQGGGRPRERGHVQELYHRQFSRSRRPGPIGARQHRAMDRELTTRMQSWGAESSAAALHQRFTHLGVKDEVSSERDTDTHALYNTNLPWDVDVNLLVYVHVQKCAGSVFKSAAEGSAATVGTRHKRVFQWFPPPSSQSYKHPGCHVPHSMHCTFSEIQTCLMSGNAIIRNLEQQPQGRPLRPLFVTLVRHPVARVISEFFWGRRNWCASCCRHSQQIDSASSTSERSMWHSQSCLHANSGRSGNFPKSMTHVFSEQDLINWVRSPENLSHNRLTKHLLAWDPESWEQWGTPLAPSLVSGQAKCASHDYTRYRAAWEARYANTSQVAINPRHLQQAKTKHLEVDQDLRKLFPVPGIGSEVVVETVTPINGQEHGLEELINKDSSLVHKAAATLSKHFWFVGLQERWSESMLCFQQLVANATAAVVAARAQAGETAQVKRSVSTRHLLQPRKARPGSPQAAHAATVSHSDNERREVDSSLAQVQNTAGKPLLSEEQWQRRWVRRGKDPHRSLAPKSRVSKAVKDIIMQYNALDMAFYKIVEARFLLSCANRVPGGPASGQSMHTKN